MKRIQQATTQWHADFRTGGSFNRAQRVVTLAGLKCIVHQSAAHC